MEHRPITSVLVANRGEIAVRVARTAAELGVRTVAVAPSDDLASAHVRVADEVHGLEGRGARAYLDAAAVVAAAVAHGVDAVHPGYGFLSESAAFAARCAEAGVVFVGPSPEVLGLFGDKTAARALAQRVGVAVLSGTGVVSPEQAAAFRHGLGDGATVLVKAAGGGGGRGMRVVAPSDDLAAALERAASEAGAAFGVGDVYLEQYLERARHVEVQVLGDRHGAAVVLGDRDCTIQRRHQKVVEFGPAPWLMAETRAELHAAALTLARAAEVDNLVTVEFLVDADDGRRWWFIEANARLQVEHTVTEAVTGMDLVALQFAVAAGQRLGDLGLTSTPRSWGMAVQLRVNAERTGPDGATLPASGTVTSFDAPHAPRVRVDTWISTGTPVSTNYDGLLAKLIVSHPGELAGLLGSARRAVAETAVRGVDTNLTLLAAVLAHPDLASGSITTEFLAHHPDLGAPAAATTAGPAFDPADPLAILDYGRGGGPEPSGIRAPGPVPVAPPSAVPDGQVGVVAPLQGTVVEVSVAPGDPVAAGQPVVVLEAMKMEHLVVAPSSGWVTEVTVRAGDTVAEGAVLVIVEPAEVGTDGAQTTVEVDPDQLRADLAASVARHSLGLDEARPEMVERRRRTGHRTARENLDDLMDPGSYVEYGPLVIAAQRRRRDLDELIRRTPADGMIAGIGTVNADLFGLERSRTVVMSYDYTVLAGTQGLQNHRKKDRLMELAQRLRLPVVFFAEGGGGRPGDTDGLGVSGLDCLAFRLWGELSGLVPTVAIVSGRCFAGNAAIAGTADVVIATRDANLGMGGPAMIEGGGLGVVRPEEVGPMDVQWANGVVDLLADDEAHATSLARRYLSYFQGAVADWTAPDQRLLRSVIPENRLRVYDVRRVLELLFDEDSVLELRAGFGPGMITALARIEGRAVGVVANNPAHLSGAVDAVGSDKLARFLQLCDAHDLPVVSLCDTPGFMVGPEAEAQALVRKACRLFVVGGSIDVPLMTVVLRKGYGLGAQAMAGGSLKTPLFCVAWPTGEFGGMGLEGAVKLGYRNELAAVEDPAERRALYEQMVSRMYEHGSALNTASHFEIDDVIDPADTRRWIAATLDAVPAPPVRHGKKRPCVDTW